MVEVASENCQIYDLDTGTRRLVRAGAFHLASHHLLPNDDHLGIAL